MKRPSFYFILHLFNYLLYNKNLLLLINEAGNLPWEESLSWIILNFSIDPEKEGETEKAASWEEGQSCRNESRGLGRDMEDRGGGAEGYRVPGMPVN